MQLNKTMGKYETVRRKPSKEYCYVPERFGNYNMRVLEAYRVRMTEALLENPDGVRLPMGLGELKILRFLPKNAPVRIDITRRLNAKGTPVEKLKKIRYNNDHSDGYSFRLFWFNRYNDGYTKSGGFRNRDLFVFKGNKLLNRGLFQQIMSGDWKHFIISTSRFTMNSDKNIQRQMSDQ